MPEMQDDQPAWMMRGEDENSNITALMLLLLREEQPKYVVEYFGGTGRMTTAIHEYWPDARIISWDKDPRCCDMIQAAVPAADVYIGDSIADLVPPPGAGVIMDFNKLTIKRFRDDYSGYRTCIERVVATMPAFVTITDGAKVRLQLHYKTYGLKSRSKEEYREAFCEELRARYGTRVVRSEEAKRAFMFIMREPWL